MPPPSPPLNMIVAVTDTGGIGMRGAIPWRLKRDVLYFRLVTTHFSEKSGVVREEAAEGAKAKWQGAGAGEGEGEGKEKGDGGGGRTVTNAVIMGRKTWESIPPKWRPLGDRINVVVTSRWESLQHEHAATTTTPSTLLFKPSLTSAMDHLAAVPRVDAVFVIGGAQVYAEALAHPACKRVFLTRVWRTGTGSVPGAVDEKDGRSTEGGLTPETRERASWDCDAFFPTLGSEWKDVPGAVEKVTRGRYSGAEGEEGGVGYKFAVLERV
ncbi:hypothetical protein M427DRAFT_29184 [Gonapodya prolifera JEL478]|uniref:Dihydrofolate reductase n=1 Tax=Gonapodya prolifera (strain JEL478) TaxID=1344416 RepID=A0A139ARF1_GONPJ|nr:hypothetical protein M427DRAFT_29184 [Gonapodya prolifera JEL478]|eukprot:KXS19224.1 hypothetical protein M427DRAFT_29184 [Gonapodya prolifera JEL478]